MARNTKYPAPTGDGLDIPEFLRVTPAEAEARRRWWNEHPPTATVVVQKPMDPAALALQNEIRELKALRQKAAKEKRSIVKVDTLGKRWNHSKCRWEIDHSQEINMGMIKLHAYDKDMKRVDRACTSVKLIDEVPSKVVHCFNRGGKAVESVSVTGENGEKVSAWVRGEDNNFVQNDTVYLTPAPAEPRAPRTKRSPASTASATTGTQPDAAVSASDSEDKPMAKKRKANHSGNSHKRGPGVISTIVETIGRASGASVDEILEVLKKKFPERKVKSMTTTIRIQAPRNANHTEKSDKRGLVYYGKA